MSRKESNMTDSEAEKRPFRANPGSGPYPTGTWIYPTLPLRVPGSSPGYRAGTAEAAVTKRAAGTPVPCCPDPIGPVEPRALFLDAEHAGRRVYSGAVLCGVYPGSNGMGLAGHRGHYYHGVPPPYYYYCSLFPVPCYWQCPPR